MRWQVSDTKQQLAHFDGGYNLSAMAIVWLNDVIYTHICARDRTNGDSCPVFFPELLYTLLCQKEPADGLLFYSDTDTLKKPRERERERLHRIFLRRVKKIKKRYNT